MTDHFADRYVAAANALGTSLCVGLDPHLELIPVECRVDATRPGSERTAAGVHDFLSQVIDECAGRVAIVKPQIAFFEQLGWRGLRVLEQVTTHARERGLLVLLDAKRGDIGSTAAAYARAYLHPDSPCRVDAITLNPYLGLDSLKPFMTASARHGVGLFILAKTSNPGAGDFQDLRVDDQPVFERVARALQVPAAGLVGASGWSNLGVVAGATYPTDLARLRQLLPSSLLLVPGFGAQGGGAPVRVAGPSADTDSFNGSIVSSSRALLFGASGSMWRDGFRARLESAREQLGAANER